MKFLIRGLILAMVLFLAACVGEHNSAPNTGLNLESKRIYGVGAEPAQLNKVYPEDEDGQAADRVAKIREKLYSK